MSVTILKGRKIVKGKVEGEALVTKDCISFMVKHQSKDRRNH